VRVLAEDLGYFDSGAVLSAGDRSFVVSHARRHKNTLLVGFEGIETRNDAEELRGVELTVGIEELRELEDGSYWPDDLVGLTVFIEDEQVGEVVGVIPGDVQDRLAIRTTGGSTFEIPFVDELVPEVLPAERKIVIAPIQGLV
jgi:16S rRNA processing protein RimM